ncbi:transglycosylase-like protein with SLT domain [Jatrophihabitans sp. GAS493]|nr:transglycosylase-like protein with SLT domain [Jatrophihabitans sp. GAS493]
MFRGRMLRPALALLIVAVAAVTVPAEFAYASGFRSAHTTGRASIPAAYRQLVERAGTRCAAAPVRIIAAQIEAESNWNPHAVSRSGDRGISQFQPGTWPNWSSPGQSPFDPSAAIPAQAKYDCALAGQMAGWQRQGMLSRSIPLTRLMLAAYNAGAHGVLRAGGIPNNGITPGYVNRIMNRSQDYAWADKPVTQAPQPAVAKSHPVVAKPRPSAAKARPASAKPHPPAVLRPSVTVATPALNSRVSQSGGFSARGTVSQIGTRTLWLLDNHDGFTVDEMVPVIGAQWAADDRPLGDTSDPLPFSLSVVLVLADAKCGQILGHAAATPSDHLDALPAGCTIASTIRVRVMSR